MKAAIATAALAIAALGGAAPAWADDTSSDTDKKATDAGPAAKSAADPASAKPAAAEAPKVTTKRGKHEAEESATKTEPAAKVASEPVARKTAKPAAVQSPVTTVPQVVTKTLEATPPRPVTPAPAPVDNPVALSMMAMASRERRPQPTQSSFGRMFDNLTPLNTQTNQELADLAQTMKEGDESVDNPKGTTAGVTFFGQFIDHDLTLDTLPQPTENVDPTTLLNNRTFKFDLDSVYGGGRKVSPQLYDGNKFKIGVAADGVSPDLPRDATGKAILIEARNDENLIIAQIHASFLRLHNALIDQGMSFEKAQSTVINAYRYVVLNDYLPQIVGEEAVRRALDTPINKGFYQPGSSKTPMTPVEFSVAAFRFGHSQVRASYDISDASGAVKIFSLDPAVPDLRGGRQIPADLVIDFNNFFDGLPAEDDEDDEVMIGRAIDTQISPGLFQLPIPGAEATGDNVLGFRNMLRAKFYDMPSYESVAAEMGVKPLRDPATGELVAPVFSDGTPLWFGILREAELTSGGGQLGPVGGRIVAETFVDIMRLSTGDTHGDISIPKPKLPDTGGGKFLMGDLVVAAEALEDQVPCTHHCHHRHHQERVGMRGEPMRVGD